MQRIIFESAENRKEVATCGYDPQSNVVPLSLDMWAKDLTAYIAAVQNNTVDAELKRFTELSLIGIINLIDLSQLHA